VPAILAAISRVVLRRTGLGFDGVFVLAIEYRQSSAHRNQALMRCPKCPSEMEVVSYRGIKVDRCTGCRGLWFQPDELAALRDDIWMADYILDKGDAKTGKVFNRITAIACPQCGTDMQQESDKEQPHIVYETCPQGHGSFFDAGEFTDLLKKTFWDRFKR
jgi:uncharacterized protein